MMTIGNIDSLTDSSLQGWIANEHSPGEPVKLYLSINNTVVDRLIANILRPDVEIAIGSGHHGFYISLTGKLQPGKNLVQIFIEENGELFSEKMIEWFNQEELKVERGLNGWLFLKNDSNNSVQTITGKLCLTAEQLNSYERLFYFRELLSERHSFKLANYIIPDKGVICNKHRSIPLEISESRPVLELLKRTQHLKTVKHPLALVSSRENFYFKTDTHPSYEGQKLIFDMILNDLGVKPCYETSQELEILSGDLGSKLNPHAHETVLKPKPKFIAHSITDTAVEAFKNGEKLTGTWTSYKSSYGLPKRVLLVGTSTAFYLREFFFSQFTNVIFCWHTALDLDTIIKFKPDYVVTLLTERFLMQVPDDNATKYNIFQDQQSIQP